MLTCTGPHTSLLRMELSTTVPQVDRLEQLTDRVVDAVGHDGAAA